MLLYLQFHIIRIFLNRMNFFNLKNTPVIWTCFDFVFLTKHLIFKRVVLDMFMGVGSTGVVALSLNHRFIVIKIGEEYYNVRRIKEAESNKADCTT